jgi:DtxR family Mn-dependent transcriptional regulator
MQALGNPRTCPHGNPIPTKTMDTLGYLRQQHALRLSAAEEGAMMKVVLISEVVEDESALLTYLGQIDIMPGARVTVLERLPQANALKVSVVPRGETPGRQPTPEEVTAKARTVSLDENLAAKIWVREQK